MSLCYHCGATKAEAEPTADPASHVEKLRRFVISEIETISSADLAAVLAMVDAHPLEIACLKASLSGARSFSDRLAKERDRLEREVRKLKDQLDARAEIGPDVVSCVKHEK